MNQISLVCLCMTALDSFAHFSHTENRLFCFYNMVVASKPWIAIPALPKCHFVIKAVKPPESTVSSRPYPYSPITLGDYLRRKRLDLGLRQKDLAGLFNTTDDSVNYWENNLKYPSVQFLPKIVQFIGYCPYDVTLPIADKLGSEHIGEMGAK